MIEMPECRGAAGSLLCFQGQWPVSSGFDIPLPVFLAPCLLFRLIYAFTCCLSPASAARRQWQSSGPWGGKDRLAGYPFSWLTALPPVFFRQFSFSSDVSSVAPLRRFLSVGMWSGSVFHPVQPWIGSSCPCPAVIRSHKGSSTTCFQFLMRLGNHMPRHLLSQLVHLLCSHPGIHCCFHLLLSSIQIRSSVLPSPLPRHVSHRRFSQHGICCFNCQHSLFY